MVSGPFRHFKHDHNFQEQEHSTLMVDKLEFQSPMGPVGSLVDAVVLRSYLRNFLETRNRALQAIAESDHWRLYLK